MTVEELIAELRTYPGDLEVIIEGYMAGTERCNRKLLPRMVDGLTGGDNEADVVVIWASISPNTGACNANADIEEKVQE